MHFRRLVLAMAFAMVATMASAAERIVMTWVPPYGIAASEAQLDALYGGAGPGNALTHLGLQFWLPTTAGDLVRDDSSGVISDAKVAEFVDWGHAHGIKVLLTVYNADPDWNWALAKGAFGDHRVKFVNALVAEMERLGLDGIDVDLEGPEMDPTADDKAKYIAFIRTLRNKVRAKGKFLTLDSFPYIWNAPNQTWWPELFPHVDALTSMGYTELGVHAPDWQAYSAQRAAAGPARNIAKLIIGVPSYESVWLGDAAVTHLQWFVPARRKVGIGIWDAQNQAAAWKTRAVWSRLRQIREQ